MWQVQTFVVFHKIPGSICDIRVVWTGENKKH